MRLLKYVKKSFVSVVFVGLLAVGCFGFFGSRAVVAEGEAGNTEKPDVWLQISPVSKQTQLGSGGIIKDSFVVENIGTKDFSYKVYASPYSVTDEDYNLSFDNENSYTQIARWIKFKAADGNMLEEATYTIKVGEKQTIEYEINVPKDVPGGGQYATLFAESIPDSADQDASGIKTVSRVGLVLYGHTDGETKKAAEITNFDYTKFLFSGNMNGTSKVKNSGNIDFDASCTLTVKSIFGAELFTKTEAVYILPETERKFNIKWEDTPPLGIFQVTMKTTALDQTREESSVVLVLPIYVVVLSILLLTVIIIWIIIIIRKRRERKARVLV